MICRCERVIAGEGTNNATKRNENITFKNNAPIRLCLSKISNTFIENAEDLDIFMPMHNL